MNRAQNRLLEATTALALVAGLLAGCANASDELKPGAAGKLQSEVTALAQSAADKDIPAATRALDLLTKDLADAVARGEVSPSRRQEIQSAIDLVRADLSAATTASTLTPTPSPSVETSTPVAPAPVTPAPGRHKGGGKGNGD
ncbi:hypothetical protein OOZ51_13415 [Arthrobacter sp. MI7-26]|uniref:hypothetical protein n=1 Tax=Arthrobacter sp. MI7-26 TaxID=2993653 RepID=UPI0022489036|nr:hypothetical protein [Arthrobacter sp. MI7-26]MCX2748803.1 hypothetical protein [Arthrobacter sp. MI7-26]